MVNKEDNKMLWIMFGIAMAMLVIGLLPTIQVAMNSQRSNSTNNLTKQVSPTPTITPTKTPLKLYTAQDVSVHNKPSDCWVIIKGYVYDLTQIISQIGNNQQIQTQLTQSCGQDATDIFDQAMKSSAFSMVKSSIDGYLQQMAIGKIK